LDSTKADKSATPTESTTLKTGGFSFGASFGQPAATAAADKPAEAPNATISFGHLGGAVADKGKEREAPATTEPPKAPAAGGFSFGNLGGVKTDKAATPAAEAPKAGGFSFGNLGGASTTPAAGSADKPADTGTATAAPAAGSLFGAKQAEATQTATPAAGGGLFGSTAAKTTIVPAAGATTTTGSGPSEPAPNLLRGKTLDDIVEGWGKDLEVQVREFERQAGEVREWDKVLVRNGDQVNLYSCCRSLRLM
jgi:nuclear pore complex protein Nup62